MTLRQGVRLMAAEGEQEALVVVVFVCWQCGWMCVCARWQLLLLSCCCAACRARACVLDAFGGASALHPPPTHPSISSPPKQNKHNNPQNNP